MSEIKDTGSVYDRLGDLLSGVLESGSIPQNPLSSGRKPEKKVSFFYIPASDSQKKVGGDFAYAGEKQDSTVTKKTEKTRDSGEKRRKPKIRLEDLVKAGIVRENVSSKARKIPNQQEKDALKILGLTGSENLDEAKKAYREKLKTFHPDRNKENPLLQKIAREKTAAILDAWKILENFYE